MSATADTDLTREQLDALILSRGFQKLLAVAALMSVLISLLAWCFPRARAPAAGGGLRPPATRGRVRRRPADVVAVARAGHRGLDGTVTRIDMHTGKAGPPIPVQARPERYSASICCA